MFWLYAYDTFGTESSYGVVWDTENDPTVENLYASDIFEEYCLRMQRWNELGLLPGDPTDTSTLQDLYAAQQVWCGIGTITPDNDLDWIYDGFETASATLVEPTKTNSTLTEYMWGIAANSERPDKAMDFLNFLYENSEVANIMFYGIEGLNYEFVEGSDTVVETNGSYYALFYRGGNTEEMLIESPAGDDFVDQLEAMDAEATVSPLLGYMFDDTDFQTESAMLDSVISEYLPQLQNGIAGSEEATLELLDEFNAALEAAGINDVIAANQEQVDAYLAEK